MKLEKFEQLPIEDKDFEHKRGVLPENRSGEIQERQEESKTSAAEVTQEEKHSTSMSAINLIEGGEKQESIDRDESVDLLPESVRTAIEKRPGYAEVMDYMERERREMSGPMIKEAQTKRNQLLEMEGLFLMSKADFYTYFSSNDFEVRADMKQQNVGDCYIIAAIHAMSRSPHFEMICRSSMEKLSNGSWQVRIPLMSENGEIITITPKELLPQKNWHFLHRRWRGKKEFDIRRKLLPVEGKEGLLVLEAAFMKHEFGSVDRLVSEGGNGDEVLLAFGGDNFRQYGLGSSVWNKDTKKYENPCLKSLNERDMTYLDYYLENFDPEIHMATALTNAKIKNKVEFNAAGFEEFLSPRHVYSISSVNAEKKMVVLANPLDTSKPVELTFDQFKEDFSRFDAIRIDSAKLLENMKKFEKKTLQT